MTRRQKAKILEQAADALVTFSVVDNVLVSRNGGRINVTELAAKLVAVRDELIEGKDK